MKTFLLLALSLGLAQVTTGQKIALKQTASASDVKVISGVYTLHFKTADLLDAIAKIDSAGKTNSADVISLLKENKIKSITLANTSATDKRFADLLKENLGSYLIIRGKVAVTKAKKPLAFIFADESPEIVELDGSSRVDLAFTEEANESPILQGNESFIFLGRLDTKLKPAQ